MSGMDRIPDVNPPEGWEAPNAAPPSAQTVPTVQAPPGHVPPDPTAPQDEMSDADKVELLERIIQLIEWTEIDAPSLGRDDGLITLDGTVHGLTEAETDYLFTINEK